jgi:hypothetical protein
MCGSPKREVRAFSLIIAKFIVQNINEICFAFMYDAWIIYSVKRTYHSRTFFISHSELR